MFAIINDYENCEIYVETLPPEIDAVEYKLQNSTIGPHTIDEIHNDITSAKAYAREEASKYMWLYNPNRNCRIGKIEYEGAY